MEILFYGSTGPYVELIQSTLKKMEFYFGNIDGNFDIQTRNAIISFQNSFGLTPDGIVGPNTWNALMPYINGYTYYTVKPGDSLYSIAEKYNTSINNIITANPNLNLSIIYPNQILVVPLGNTVLTNIKYISNFMDMNISALKVVYPFIEIGNIGYSVLGDNIPYVKIGRGQKQVLYSASFHANESITTNLLMKFIENYCSAIRLGSTIYGFDARNLFDTVSIYIIPMVNPDGVNLVNGAFPQDSTIYNRAKIISNNFESIPFPSGWKANINGVDLNLQFPAEWEKAKEIKFAQGYTQPAPRDFVGYGPLTEPESLAIYNFTLTHNFRLILAYHTQGQEIYWQFLNYAPEDALEIANTFADASGYTVANVPYESGFAGFKDWFVQNYNLPGFTIEAGIGENPLPISQFNEIYDDNIGILVLGAVL